jgi:hypothetical protein
MLDIGASSEPESTTTTQPVKHRLATTPEARNDKLLGFGKRR